MSNPDPRHSDDPQRSAEAAPTGRPAERGEGPETRQFTNPDAALGGADAVQKTSYGVGQGTEPEAQAGSGPTAHPPAGQGPNYLAWGVGAVAVLVALVYLLGVLA